MYTVTREQQIEELVDRVPPIINVSIVIQKDWKLLVGRRALNAPDPDSGQWLFPGSRMKFEETPQETALRVLKNEVPGINAVLKKEITVISDKGYDKRAYGITIYYLFDYLFGETTPNSQLDEFLWVDKDSFAKLDSHPKEREIFNEIDLAIRTMNTTEDEILTEVDKDDKEIGSIVKREAHANPARYHRAAWIFIFNSKNEIVLQQRGFNKTHNPGLWDMAGGHQIFGNTIDQTANQELREELGIETKLTLSHIKLNQNSRQSEYAHIYYGFADGPYKFDPNEVAAIHAFDCQKLLNHEYDSEFKIMEHIFDQLEILRSVWQKI